MVKIRPAEIRDAEGIARVHIETWRVAYHGLMPESVLQGLTLGVQGERWEQSLAHPKRTSTVVAELKEAVIAFASFGPEPGNDYRYQGELSHIYVLPPHQRRGIGTRLLREAAQGLLQHNLPNMLLWVLSSNPARQWCERLGGRYLRDRVLEFGGQKLKEAAYGWDELHGLAGR